MSFYYKLDIKNGKILKNAKNRSLLMNDGLTSLGSLISLSSNNISKSQRLSKFHLCMSVKDIFDLLIDELNK